MTKQDPASLAAYRHAYDVEFHARVDRAVLIAADQAKSRVTKEQRYLMTLAAAVALNQQQETWEDPTLLINILKDYQEPA